MESHSLHPQMYELIQREFFRPDEVAALFDIDLAVVRHAAFTGELHARIVNHHIVSIRRDHLLIWLHERDGLEQYPPAPPLN